MVYVVLPAYNEVRGLPALLDAIRSVEWPDRESCAVVVVDDGSTDATVPVCRARWHEMSLEVICHGRNLGQGAAMMTGLRQCLWRCGSSDAIVTMAADNTHSPSMMPEMVRALRSGSDIVIASRCIQGTAPHRKVLDRGADLMLRAAFPIPGARDYTCGYRAYSSEILIRGLRVYSDRLIEEKGCVCTAELLVKLGAIGARVAEVPLAPRADRDDGENKTMTARAIAGYLRLATLKRPRVSRPDSGGIAP
jgi:dolichol-phosphate mannosyltransferase